MLSHKIRIRPGGVRLAGLMALALMVGCHPAGSVPPVAADPSFPLSAAGPGLRLGASLRPLTARSSSVTVQLVASTPFADVEVSLLSADGALDVVPAPCRLARLLPPQAAPGVGASPHALPQVPLCSFVLRAAAAGRFPVTLIVRDASGKALLEPVHSTVVFN